MSTVPYTGHKAPGRLRCDDSTELGRLDYKLRVAVCDGSDLMVDAADMLKVIAKERDAADARVTEVLAERDQARADLEAMRVDRDRLHTKVSTIAGMLEPQRWAENSRNRTLLSEVVFDGTPAPVLVAVEDKAA